MTWVNISSVNVLLADGTKPLTVSTNLTIEVSLYLIGSDENCMAWILSKINPLHMTISPWWRHEMEPFSALLAICARNSPATGEFPAQRPVTRSFDVFFDLRLN